MEIRFCDVSFQYEDAPVVSGCSLRIASGEQVALLGPSGCGKSTLLKLMLGLVQPQQGQVLLDGKLAGQGQPVSALLAESKLFPWMTLLENLCLVGDKQQAWEYLDILGMRDWADAYPSAISVGMTQKIRIARMAMIPAQIWLLDEPFNGLDLRSKETVQAFLRQTGQGKTTVLVTHNLAEASAMAGRILTWERQKHRPDRSWTANQQEEIRQFLLQAGQTVDGTGTDQEGEER